MYSQPLSTHDCSHILYYLTPNLGLLQQKEHIDMIQIRAVSVDQSEISITSLIPASASLDNEEERVHWQKIFAITNKTLDEDWALSVFIQESIRSNAVPHLQYGRNEWALNAFNDVLNNLRDAQ